MVGRRPGYSLFAGPFSQRKAQGCTVDQGSLRNFYNRGLKYPRTDRAADEMQIIHRKRYVERLFQFMVPDTPFPNWAMYWMLLTR